MGGGFGSHVLCCPYDLTIPFFWYFAAPTTPLPACCIVCVGRSDTICVVVLLIASLATVSSRHNAVSVSLRCAVCPSLPFAACSHHYLHLNFNLRARQVHASQSC